MTTPSPQMILDGKNSIEAGVGYVQDGNYGHIPGIMSPPRQPYPQNNLLQNRKNNLKQVVRSQR